MTDKPECLHIRENLDALADDTLSDAMREHVANCDECRDLRHEVRETARLLGGAGGDYKHPEDFAQRVLAAADSKLVALESGAAPSSEAAARAESAASPEPRKPLFSEKKSPLFAQSSAEPRRADAPDAPPVPDAAVERSERAEPSKAEGAKVVPLRKSNAGPLLALVGVAAMAAMIPVGIKRLRARGASEPGATQLAQNPGDGWSGRLALVSRAAADRNGGVQVRAPGAREFAPLAQGSVVRAGSEVRTDARTRARIDLQDGTQFVLDRSTTLKLDTVGPRVATLTAGALAADVAHLENAPSAKITLPTGAVTVLGTRFVLTADDARSTLRVTRGNVRVEGQSGSATEVKTGMEGVLARNAAPSVSPAINLASSVSWSELGSQSTPVEPDAPVQGLGELRARRPGQSNEQDHAVSLAVHRVKVRIVGNLARTEIEEVFRNDTGNELEGIYRFPLPPEAQIERLALDVNGEMEQGAFVDKTRAAAIWRGVIRNAVRPIQQRTETEDLVWVPGPWRDPALLEWQRGGRFELRIFPIPARGQRRVSIAYTQTIAPSAGGLRRYVYPLAHDANGSTRVEQFDVDVQVMGHDQSAGVRARGYALSPNADVPSQADRTRLSFSQGAFVPAGDLVLEYAMPNRDAIATAWAFKPQAQPTPTTPTTPPSNGTGGANVAQAGSATTAPDESSYVAIALRPQLPRWSDSHPRDYSIVIDTSRSMIGERIARASRLARAMVAEMDPRDRVTVLACDLTCREIQGGLRFASSDTVRAIESFLSNEQPQGATDLVAQVRAAARALPNDPARDQRIVYIGDGAASAGYRRPDRVATEVGTLMPSSRATLTTVAIGADADSTLLSAMARAGGGVMSPYVPGESTHAAALSVLEGTYGVTLRDPSLVLPEGLTEIAPTRLATVRAGSEVIVVARMRGARVQGDAVLRGTVGGEPFETRIPIDVRESTDRGNAFVPRLYAAGRIAELEANGGPSARDEIVRLSQRFRVASRYTSLLVLEGERMYRAFGVERNLAAEADWTGEDAAISTSSDRRADTQRDPDTANRAATNGPIAASATTASAERENNAGPNLVNAEPVGASSELQALAQQSPIEEQRQAGGTGQGYGVGTGLMGTLGHSALAGGAARNESGAATDEDAPTEASGAVDGLSNGTLAANAGGASAGEHLGDRAATIGGMGGFGGGRTRGAPAPSNAPTAATTTAPTTTPTLPQQPNASNTRRSRSAARIDDGRFFDQQMQQPRGGQWMRRIWVRESALIDAPSGDASRIQNARLALALEPDSRGRHRDFYKVLSLAGQFAEADEVARRWSTRDAMDPDALVRLAEVAARRGEREVSMRILSGIADVRANDRAQLERLVTLFDRAGDSERACSMRVSLAETFASDLELIAGAALCERTLGRSASSQRWLDSVSDPSQRTALEAAVTRLSAANAASNSARGELVVEASWDAPTDLDIAVIDPKGTRISWAWGRTRGLTIRDASANGREALGLSTVQQSGDYVIELSRATRNSGSVRGTVTVRAMGHTRTFRVSMESHEDTRRVGAVRITRVERLVPAT